MIEDADTLPTALAEELRADPDWSMPVRTMEHLLGYGRAALRPLMDLLSDAVDEDYEAHALWATILLGELRDPVAAPGLVDMIARVPEDDLLLRQAAAESLSAIGAGALPALRTLASSQRAGDRLLAYFAAGRMNTEAALEFLLLALESDRDMSDILALALADLGDADAIEPLHRALGPAHAWHRPEIESAIRDLHNGTRIDEHTSRDWRLRYRVNSFNSVVPQSWLTIVSILREAPEARKRELPVRALHEILALEPEPLPAKLCECCAVEQWLGTGVRVCPETATAIPVMQADLLRRRRDQNGSDDIFDILNDVDADLLDLAALPEPRGRRKREKREDEGARLRIEQGALMWAVERGAESVGAARAMLLAEAAGARSEFGDAMGVFETDEAPPSRAQPRVGRNDPCPCGSGRKYKKCCGRAERAAHSTGLESARRPPMPAAGSGIRLMTFDNEPVVFSRAHYTVSDRDALVAALRDCADLEEEEGDANRFVWFRDVDDEERRVLGSIDLTGPGMLVLECMSSERLERGKRLIGSIAGPFLEHRSDSVQDPWQAVAEAEERGGPRPARDVPPEIAGPLIKAFLDKQYRKWPDEPLPALDGQTAREAVRTRKGREAVTGLLLSFEALERGKPEASRYDFTWLWHELGLERPVHH